MARRCYRFVLAIGLVVFSSWVWAAPPSPPPAPVPYIQPCWQTPSLASLPFCNASLDSSARAQDLVERMTMIEKLSQLGSWNASGNEVPRLGVPRYSYHSEGLHGLRTVCRDMPGVNTTTFPQVVGMAATGNLELIGVMGRIMGDEGRAANNIANGTIFAKGTGLDYWGPTMNIGRDPRW